MRQTLGMGIGHGHWAMRIKKNAIFELPSPKQTYLRFIFMYSILIRRRFSNDRSIRNNFHNFFFFCAKTYDDLSVSLSSAMLNLVEKKYSNFFSFIHFIRLSTQYFCDSVRWIVTSLYPLTRIDAFYRRTHKYSNKDRDRMRKRILPNKSI